MSGGLLRALAGLYQHIRDPNKEARQRLQELIATNPSLLSQLSNSVGVDSDPARFLKTLGIDDARWGGGSDFTKQFSQQLANIPITDTEKTMRLSRLGEMNPTDITNASKSVPNLSKAFSSNEEMLSKMGSIGQGSEALLNDTQKDLRSKFLGLPTAVEKKKDALEISGREQSTATSKAEENLLKEQLIGTKTSNQAKATDLRVDEEKRGRINLTKEYLKSTNQDPYKAYYNKSTPTPVKQAIFEDDGLKNQFEAESTKAFHDSSLELQKKSLSARTDMDIMLQQARMNHALNVANKFGADPKDVMSAMSFQGDRSKLLDPKFKPSSPEEQSMQRGAIALKQAGDLIPEQQKRSSYNEFKSRNKDQFLALETKGVDMATGKAIVEQINADARNYFGQFGIDAPQWDYDKKYNKGGLMSGGGIINTPPKIGISNPGDPLFGLKLDKETEESAQLESIAKLIESGQANLEATLKDPQMTPEMAEQLKKRLKKPQGK